MDYKDPWLILTDFKPEEANVLWYGLRSCTECVYRDFKSEYHRLHRESVAAFKEFRSDVLTGAYPTAKNDVSIDKKEFESFLKAIK